MGDVNLHRREHHAWAAPALLKGFIVTVLIAYAVGGFLTELRPPFRERDLIPLFSWFIFATVPNDARPFAVLIHEYDGRPLDPPLLFGEATGIISNPRSSQAADLFQRWGWSALGGDAARAEGLRRVFEESFLYRPARYELVETNFNPVERWRTGRYTIERRWPYAFDPISP